MNKFLPLALAAMLSGCGNLGYYAHLAKGQYQLLSQREKISAIVADPSRDEKLRSRLKRVAAARAWAIQALGLPDNGSYTLYADLGRPYVVWNVFAAPEFSLEPVQHCFLVVGCLAYRGYFDEAGAKAKSAELAAAGNDVYVSGIPAYSTLGWFDDPVLSSMMRWDDEMLIGTVFHELAHQKLYVKNDTAFNESFASFVEEEGLRQYLAVSGQTSDAHRLYKQRQHQFVQMVLGAREQLAGIYAGGLTPEEMRARKLAVLASLRRDYAQLRDQQWQGWNGYDRWFEGELNNAKLLPFGLYDAWIPAFATLYAQQHQQWNAFYAAAKKLGELEPDARAQQMNTLKGP